MARERLKHAMQPEDMELTNGKRTCVEQTQQQTLEQDLPETTPQGSQRGWAKTGVTRLRSRAAQNSSEDTVIGIVERVELIDFMCHERADVQLCPKVNFITGQNGSGKSAILTGLIIALGGKATSTNRAPNLREFVREGRTRAIVRVELRNQGPEAYRPELFGSSIIIERQINSGGALASQFKVKNGDNGDVVSKKKEDVVAITDHMAIQIDNPINILSQDAAREFLASTSPDKMYHFFLKGTQLFQLREDLEVVRQAITRAEGSIDRKKEVLPEMKAEKKRWEQHYEDMRQARDLSAKMTSLSHQMAWAHVEEAEAEVQRADEDIEVQGRKLGKIDEKVDAENSAISEINEKVQELEEQARTKLTQLEPLQAERRGPLGEIESIKVSLRSLKQTEEEINSEARSTRERVDSLKRDIETERGRLVDKDSAGKERLKARIIELENDVVDREGEIASLQEQQKSIETQTLELGKVRDQRRAEATKAQQLAERAKTGLHELMQQTSDQLSAYGRGVREALAQIKKSSWRDMEPIGPLGKHIKLRDPKWSRIIETTLDKTLNAFLVGSHADRIALDAIFRRCGCQSRIIVCSSELFDYTQGEPDSQFLTILRALEVDNEIVKRQLINLNRIEQIILVEQRALGDKIMVSNGGGFPHNVTACLSADGYNVGARGGGLSTQAVNLVRPSNRLGEDISQAIEREKQTVATLSREMDAAQRALDEQMRESEKMLREHKRAATAERQCRERINKAKSEIQQVRERLLSDEPAKIAALENELETFTDQLESIKTQFRDHMAQQKAKEHQLRQVEAGVTLIDKKIEAVRSQADLLRQASEKKASQCQKHSNNIEYWISKRSTLEEKMATLRRQKDEVVSRVATVEADARKVCPERVAIEYEPRRLDRLISECRARLEEIERSSSMSLGDVAEKAQMHIAAYTRAKDELRGTVALVSKLKTAHQQRLQRWTHFRDSMAMRTKLHFIKNLHQRGYTGKLEFDHSQCTLQPKVKTDQDLVSERLTNGGGAAASPGRSGAYQRKDTRSLSGGEKSFTTICLLLSLWETMNCPVRALDEFDVFMDAANRRIAMSMMIDSARSQKATQFILITPQDMSVKPDADITILRLQPPARSAAAT